MGSIGVVGCISGEGIILWSFSLKLVIVVVVASSVVGVSFVVFVVSVVALGSVVVVVWVSL